MTSRLKIYAAVAVAASLLLQGCVPDTPVEIPDEVTAPANVRLVSSDKTSLVFEWDEVKGAIVKVKLAFQVECAGCHN